MKIAIIDYGMGNLHSVLKSCQVAEKSAYHSAQISITNQPDEVMIADKVIFPGQGAMPDCMQALHQSGLADAILHAFQHKPFLGICVGAQLLFEYSEEGMTTGLSWFSGYVKKFSHPLLDTQGQKLKVPHMGWNQVQQTQAHPLFKDIENNSRFYFVHSYYFAPQHTDIVLGTSQYPEDFACIIGRDNVFATQFHVEKSHNNGLSMLRNFIDWDGSI